MKSDARYLLNKKKWKNQLGKREENWRNRKILSRGTVDARKILNSKREKKVNSNEIVAGFHKNVSKSKPISKKQFFAFPKTPDKQVQLSKDGNIWITSRPKTDTSVFSVAHPSPKLGIVVSARSKQLQTNFEPWESDADDLEHIGIDDLMDMDSLPSALIPAKSKRESKTAFPRKSLAEQVLAMNNTMVADQELAAAMQQSVTVYVTNLRSSVSKQDIVELFGDIGQIKSAELCYPGTAVIEFFTQEDAEKACEIYHNRLLDGQPMKCCIQPILRPARTSVSQRLGERIAESGTSPHPFTSSEATSSRSRYNPRNVQFTVKLA